MQFFWNNFCIIFALNVKPMKKFIPLAAICLLWAASVMGSELPPYGQTHSDSPFYTTPGAGQSDRAIEIFPNPVTEGRITIKSDEGFRSVQIMNITGEIVFNREYPMGSTTEVIELDKLEKGIYLVRIGFTGKVNHTEKIMIK
jgi:hypothetical protein